jgi:hypothetical protein
VPAFCGFGTDQAGNCNNVNKLCWGWCNSTCMLYWRQGSRMASGSIVTLWNSLVLLYRGTGGLRFHQAQYVISVPRETIRRRWWSERNGADIFQDFGLPDTDSGVLVFSSIYSLMSFVHHTNFSRIWIGASYYSVRISPPVIRISVTTARSTPPVPAAARPRRPGGPMIWLARARNDRSIARSGLPHLACRSGVTRWKSPRPR